MIELRQIKAFIAVAEEGGFTAASERLHTVQPNISMRIKSLEETVGKQLFLRSRTRRELRLTEAGKKLLPKAYEIMQIIAEFKQENMT
jgi:DNA-binding transcriptional LysR family regulator